MRYSCCTRPGRSSPRSAPVRSRRRCPAWAEESPKPLVVLIDEIETLIGDALVSVLRQLRAANNQRPERFPQSVGVVRGSRRARLPYPVMISGGEIITGGSAFNIKAESLRLGDFSQTETWALLVQHTEEGGQAFMSEAIATVCRQTQGQPWLVNALCQWACFRGEACRDCTRPITEPAILDAQEQLILAQRRKLKTSEESLCQRHVWCLQERLRTCGRARQRHETSSGR